MRQRLLVALWLFTATAAGWSSTRLKGRQSSRLYSTGRVVRLAVRPFAGPHSKPSSPLYTTRKQERDSLLALVSGAVDDYNHYRTIALANTTDRAISILTTDCLEFLEAHNYPVQLGDLGENILVDGFKFNDLIPDSVYSLGHEVIIQVTEPIVACANLCKLDYINNPEKTPKQRIQACNEFLDVLDLAPGLRGWYAKVLKEGTIEKNCDMVKVDAYKEE
jgi:hypothetical protein